MNASTQISVALGDRSYPITIGQQLLSRVDLLAPHLKSRQICVITNTTVASLHEAALLDLVRRTRSDAQITSVHLPDGEAFKTMETLGRIFDALLKDKHNRNTTILALGGGVVGDMAGFAAACYQRGVAFVQIPTTLLSQVDSSVGGKTGVNHPLGKNMIGAFYQPKAVLIDVDLLSTLPDRELAAGLAEVIKYGLIADASFFSWLENNIEALNQRDPEALIHAIKRSCEIKAEVVSKDEHESGLRAILNFGHTYGHAIETEMGYGTWLHGEAVAAGMAMACELSVDLGWLEPDVLERTRRLLEAAHLPTHPPTTMTAKAFLEHMSVDKKVLDGSVRLVLLRGCGHAVVTSEFDQALFQAQLSRI